MQIISSAKRILFVNYGWNESGGGTIFPHSVANSLVNCGYEVFIFYASLNNNLSLPPCSLEECYDGKIRLFGLINRPALFADPDNPQREINDPLVLKRFRQVLDIVQPDLVHFHNFHGLTLALAEETFHRKIPSCYTPHNFYMIDPELYMLKNGLQRWDSVDTLIHSESVARNPHLVDWYRKRIETTLCLMNKWINLTLSVSRRQKELLVSYGADGNRIAIVHQASPVSDELWSNPAVASETLRMVKRPLRVGYIGGVIPIKGVQMLVSAVQSLSPDDVQLHLYGFTDPRYEDLLHYTDSKCMVTYHGPYTPADLPNIAHAIDVAVIPTLVEDCAPLTLLELHAMRLPVIASRIGGIPDFITEGVDGFLYDPDDRQKLISILHSIIEQPVLLVQMRQNLTAPTHTFNNYLDHLKKVYMALISGHTLNSEKLSLLVEPRKNNKIISLKQISISWQGALFASHSLAHVNRELCLQLLGRSYPISFIPSEPDDFLSSVDGRFERLEVIRNLPTDRPDITIRHQWPPDFSPVAAGKLVLIQPWEFGSLPKSWIEPMNTVVDEVWVPSTFVRDCYLQSGVAPGRVQVVPNGVNTQLFSPDATPQTLATRKSFRFLFVGGTIQRKGIDILLGAYRQTFTAHDDVCLVIKDMGTNSFYQGQTAQELIQRFRSDSQAPEIEYIDRDLSPTEMASLYTSCHCLVHPYRGEGFGLPIAEAMACGLAPIVTGYGAALDFCPPEIAWLIPARIETLPVKQIGRLETVDYPWLAEPDFDDLVSLLRHVVSSPEEQTFRGLAAVDFIRNNFTWEHAARKADERLKAILQTPIRRLTCTSTLVASETYNSSVEASQLSILVQGVCSKAGLLAQEGEVDQAVQLLLHQGIRVTPEDAAPYCVLVEILLRASRYQDALDVLPEMPTTTDEMLKQEFAALCHCALGDNDAAGRAAGAAAGRPRALVVLGTLAARQGDLQQAELYFRQAIVAGPACGNGWLSLGMLLWGQGKHDEAFAALKRAVMVDPLNREAVQILRDMAERLDAGLAPCNTSIG